MKKFLVSILIIFPIIAFSQNIKKQPIPNEAFDYVNNINKYWHKEEHDTAIAYASKLIELYPPFLVNKIHYQLAEDIENKEIGASDFLVKIYNTKNKKINKIIKPIYLWNMMRVTQSEDSILVFFDDLNEELKMNALTVSKPELYMLNAFNELDKKKIENSEYKKNISLFIIKIIEEKLIEEESINDRNSIKNRAYLRSILSYTYFYLSKIISDPYLLKMASFYSLDKLDQQNNVTYISTLRFLTGKSDISGFRMNYIDYLIQNNQKEEALKFLSILTLGEPINSNINKLKSLFEEIYPSSSFKNYWYTAFSSSAEKLPEFNIKTLNGIDTNSSDFNNKWTLVDFWGTWCNPCVSELPEIEKFYIESKKKYDGKLNVITISYESKNIKVFLESNNYSFPVFEIDENNLNKLKVRSFPTKILISPNRNYITFPSGFGINWIEYIDNYTMLK